MHSKTLQKEVMVMELSPPDKVLPLSLVTISSVALGIQKVKLADILMLSFYRCDCSEPNISSITHFGSVSHAFLRTVLSPSRKCYV